MTRLAFLSPLPPAATGIADYSADVLALLAPRYEIEVFHAQTAVDRERIPAGCDVRPVAELVARHRERPFDLAIHQLGNAPEHDFVYPPLVQLPGLLVLHDLVLHHSRARALLDTDAARAYARNPSSAALRDRARADLEPYRAELAYSYPRQGPRLLDAQLATSGDLLPYAYPLFRLPVEASRAVAVHNDFCADAVRDEVPEATVVRIPMAVQATSVDGIALTALRARYGFAPDDFVVGSFGLLTREKRVGTTLRALARAAVGAPRLRLLLVGPVPDRPTLEGEIQSLGVEARVTITGRVPLSELPAHMELADAVVHLRYPTARETSAALLRVLAQGRPTILSDLEHLSDVPRDAVLRADVRDEEGEVTRGLLKLATQPSLRARLGRAAAAFAAESHAPARCLEGYDAAIAAALSRTARPRAGWPAHWRA